MTNVTLYKVVSQASGKEAIIPHTDMPVFTHSENLKDAQDAAKIVSHHRKTAYIAVPV